LLLNGHRSPAAVTAAANEDAIGGLSWFHQSPLATSPRSPKKQSSSDEERRYPHSACAPLEKPLELEMKWNKKI